MVGTRPEAIKMAPVIMALREQSWADVRVVATEQHRELAADVFDLFGIEPDIELDLMRHGQSLSGLTARALAALDRGFADLAPDLVIAQGDTTSVMAVAMTCFYRQIPFAHVEAGLRSFDLQNPYPEEFNRIVASRIATLHFAPTEQARAQPAQRGGPGRANIRHRKYGHRFAVLGRGADQPSARDRGRPAAATGDGPSQGELRRTVAKHLPCRAKLAR